MAKKKFFTFIDLFSGIGGFHAGIAPLGGKCIMASDINEVANQSYYANFKLKPKGDICKIKAKDIPDFDLLCGGFPCQPFSQVGQKGGLNDERGQLIYEVFRILKEKQPKAFILENVRGLVNMAQGTILKMILKELDDIGYDVSYKVLEAKDYGTPQLRKRLFIVGVRKDLGIKFEFPTPVPLKYTFSQIMGGRTEREYSFTIRIGGRRSGINNRYNWDCYRVDDEPRFITPEECLMLQGFDKNHILCGNQSQQYAQVGNSVPVSIVNLIGKKLVDLGTFS